MRAPKQQGKRGEEIRERDYESLDPDRPRKDEFSLRDVRKKTQLSKRSPLKKGRENWVGSDTMSCSTRKSEKYVYRKMPSAARIRKCIAK